MSRARAAAWPAGAIFAIAAMFAVAAPPALAAPSAPPVAAPAAGHAERVEYRDPAAPPARGPTYAPVTIEVFFVPGPNMPIAGLRLLQQLQERHPARVRLVYRILKSGSAVLIPSTALAAQTDGKFFELMDELVKQRSALKKDELLELAHKIGIDPQRVDQALERYRDVLDANQRRFERLHAASAPAIAFNAQVTKLLLVTASVGDLEREYEQAYTRALDKLERGFTLASLAQAFDDDAMLAQPTKRRGSGLADDDGDRPPLPHPLASPPLALDGLPSFGKAGVTAAVSIVVLCRPTDDACGNLLRVVEPQARLYPDEVRVVWAPWFEAGRDDTAELSLLGDATLCAESIGSNQGELTTSPGWRWLREMYAKTGRRNRSESTEQLIDAIASSVDLDRRALSACRARLAGRALRWVAAARRSSVLRTDTAIMIGGRIYPAQDAQPILPALVEAELAPGALGSLPRWHTTK